MSLAELRQQAEQYADTTGKDMNVATKGGGSRLLPAGPALLTLVEYIECGRQPQEFQGKQKEPQLEVRLAFAVHGPEYANEDGSPYIIRMFPMALHSNDKAQAFKMFKAMNYTGLAKNFGQMLGQSWVGKIVHEAKSKTDQTIVSRIDRTTFNPPIDPMSRQLYAIPNPVKDDDYRLFIWDNPTQAGWASLFIEGKTDDGKSKNFIQEQCLAATDYPGSPLQLMLEGSNTLALPTANAAAAAQVLPTNPQVAAPVVPQTVAAPTAMVSQPASTAPQVGTTGGMVSPTVPLPVLPTLPVTTPTPVTTSPSEATANV